MPQLSVPSEGDEGRVAKRDLSTQDNPFSDEGAKRGRFDIDWQLHGHHSSFELGSVELHTIYLVKETRLCWETMDLV